MKRFGGKLALVLLMAMLLCPKVPVSADSGFMPEQGSMAAAALEDCLYTIDGGAWSTAEGAGHLQGICCDDELEYMYFSFTDRLIKVDMRTGERVGTMTGLRAGSISSGAHLGCLAYRDGLIYGTLEYKVEKRWYIAVIDPSKITGDVLYSDPGVMYGIHIPDVDEDFKDNLDAGEHYNSESSMGHRYGLGGIDGITFGKLPGAPEGSKEYMLMAYAPYGNASRYDNNNQIVNVYDPDKIEEYMLPFAEDRNEPEGLRCEEQLFVYTGNQTWGTQNMEFDKDTGDLWLMCYGRPSGSKFPGGSMYVIDGSEPLYMDEVEVGQSVPNTSGDYDFAMSKAYCYQDEYGNYPQANHMTLKCICGRGDIEAHEAIDYAGTGHAAKICIGSMPASATTGFISLGDDYFYAASQGQRSIGGVTHEWGSATLYKLDRETMTFTAATKPAKLLLSYTMDAADTYEKNGEVYLKDMSGNGYDALVEGTYAAEDKTGKAGGALGFRGYRQGDVFDRVSATAQAMEFVNEEVENAYSYSFWVYNEREMDRFTPVIGMYRDNDLQEGLYSCVFEWRYRSTPTVTSHHSTMSPEYKTLPDGTTFISRPGTNGGDSSTFPHGTGNSGLMGKWMHYVVTRVGNVVSIYCNGEKTNSTGVALGDNIMENLTHFSMGGGIVKNWKDANTRTRFSGVLDDVRLYSGAVTLEQARTLYQAGPAVSSASGSGAVTTVKDKVFAEPYVGPVLGEQSEPILHYAMDETGTVKEKNGRDALSTKWVTTAVNQEGQTGRALAFDGHQFTKPAKVSAEDEDVAWLDAQLKTTGKVTISFWMKATHENGSRMTVLGLYDKTGRPVAAFEARSRLEQNIIVDGKFAIGFASAKPYEGGELDEATYEQLASTVKPASPSSNYGDKQVGTWYHVVGELDQTQNVMRLYVDGQLVETVSVADGTLDEIGYFLMGTCAGRYYSYENAANTSNGGVNTTENTYERQGWAMRGEYVGLLDDVRVYNRILSSDEVAALYEAGTEYTAQSYEINSVTLEDGQGNVLPAIPARGGFTVRVEVLKAAYQADALLMVAAYTDDGKLLEIDYLQAYVPNATRYTFGSWVKNPDGDVGRIKVFLIASFASPVPLVSAVELD